MICPICGEDFSDSVHPYHVDHCTELKQQADAAKEQDILVTIEKAEVLGVKNAQKKNLDTLKKEISEIEDKKLQNLRKLASELGVDDVENKSAETLQADIAMVEAKSR
jgi:thiaminase